MICGVIIDKEAKELNREFDYNIPNHLLGVIQIGCRVKVPFRNTVLLGYVISIKEKSEFNRLKNVIECLDIIPTFTHEMIDMAKYIAYETSSFISSCLNIMIPSGMKAKYKKYIRVLNDKSEFTDNTPYEKINDYKALKREILEGVAEVVYDFEEKTNAKEEVYATLKDFNYVPKTNNEKEVLQFLTDNVFVKKSILNKEISRYTVKSLEKKNVIELVKKEEYRIPKSRPEYKKVDLNDNQKKAFKAVDLNKHEVYLLHGVTGSGKTEVYLELIEEVIKEKNVVFLVPEISLTPMFSNRLKGRFNNLVAVLHSKLSNGERYDEFRRIQNGDVKIVVGPRSAIFAPLDNIGLIIVDEEHEDSYIQDVNPRYNAIDLAILRAKRYNAPIILGSATPNVIHYKRALDGEYKLINLPNRAQGKMPKSYVVDMKKELINGNKGLFSELLIKKIGERLINNEQSILLLNRRGFSSFVMCRSCGYTVKCKNCDITLTYHKSINKLRCHYCGYEENNVSECPDCKSTSIRFVGVGTERVEEEINSIFKDVKTLRMDIDTVSKKNSADDILDSFKKGEANILIGTQMIAKGLDFENVTLVGILNADMTLKLPGYKMSEKAFDLISQVSGRAGRHKDNGEVVIQGYDVEHYAIKTALNNDYHTFYEIESRVRRIASYPPYSTMKRIIFQSNDLNLAYNEAMKIKNRFNEIFENLEILGPSLCDISKINNLNRVQIILRYNDIDIKPYLFKLVEFYKDKEISINIDEM